MAADRSPRANLVAKVLGIAAVGLYMLVQHHYLPNLSRTEGKLLFLAVGAVSCFVVLLGSLVWKAFFPDAKATEPRALAELLPARRYECDVEGAHEASNARVTIGDDGLVVESVLHTWFVDYASVRGLTTYTNGIGLALPEEASLVVHPKGALPAFVTDLRAALTRYTAEAATAGARTSTAALLEAHVAGKSGDAGGYRVAAIDRDALWELVEAAPTPAATRALAARELIAAGEPDVRMRLSSAGSRIADPKARVALADALAHAPEEQMEEARKLHL